MPATDYTKYLINQALIQRGIFPGLGGSVFYVNSQATGGLDANNSALGLNPTTPFSSLDFAFSQCVTSRGDVIVALPGHTETLTAAGQCQFDIAGVTLIGVGTGSNKPTITLATLTSTDVDVDAANVRVINIRFVSGIDDLAIMLDVNAGGTTFEDCEFIGPATLECLNFVNIASTFDDYTFLRCRWLQNADPAGTDGAAATGGIYLVDTENVRVEDCTFDGFFETACIHNKTTACKYLTVRGTSTNQQLTITGKKFLFPAATVGVQIHYETDPTWYSGLGYKASKTEDNNTAVADALFTLTGKVKINLWHCEVTNALGAGNTDYKIELTTLAGILVAAGDISSAIVGFMRNLNGDSGDTMLSQGSPAVSVAGVADSQGHSGHLVVGKAGGADVIKATRTAGAAADEIIHTVYYQPLEPGAGLTDAA